MVMDTLIFYLIAYVIVTIMASMHFLYNWKVKKQQAFDSSLGLHALKANATQFEAFKTTKPFHPLYNVMVFPIVGVVMMGQFSIFPTLTQSLGIGVLWIVYGLVLDLFCWVIIPHPWRLTLKDLFVTYQPWITLAYISIGLSPLISMVYLSLFMA